MRHATDTDNLIRSDLEELRGEPEPEFSADGPQQSLLVQFQLPSSTYATMVLREILKEDTSPANQSKLGMAATAAAEAAAAAAAAEANGAATGEKRKLAEGEDDEEDDDADEETESDVASAKKSKTD